MRSRASGPCRSICERGRFDVLLGLWTGDCVGRGPTTPTRPQTFPRLPYFGVQG